MAMMAIKDPAFRIVNYPTEEARVPLCPLDNFAEAEGVLAEAEKQRPDILWKIVGKGPWGVRG